MKTQIFLETALSSDSAIAFLESNRPVIDVAVAEIDFLTAENHRFILSNLGEFIEKDFNDTFESIEDRISDIVEVATCSFGEVVADESLSGEQKVEEIEALSYIIAMEGTLGLVAGDAAKNTAKSVAISTGFRAALGTAGSAGAIAKGAASQAGGAVAGGAAGAAIQAYRSKLSNEYKHYKQLVDKEKHAVQSHANPQALEHIRQEKEKAKEAYTEIRNAMMKKGVAAGATVGSMLGIIAKARHLI